MKLDTFEKTAKLKCFLSFVVVVDKKKTGKLGKKSFYDFHLTLKTQIFVDYDGAKVFRGFCSPKVQIINESIFFE